jgi:hypothetical protein
MFMHKLLLIMISCLFTASAVYAQVPVLTEVINFAPIPVGARRELRLRIERLPAGGTYQVMRAPLQPFAITSDQSDLTVRGNEIEIRVEYVPVAEGDHRDEIVLQRTPSTGQGSVDDIRIRLFGTAFRIVRTDEVVFGDVMTGDTAKQGVLYRANRNDDFSFAFLGAFQEPFTMLTAQGPVRRGFDTLALVIAFSPSIPGNVADTVGLIRRDRQGRELDTAFIYVSGIGREMPKEVVVDLRDLNAGDYASRTVRVDLPTKVYTTEFSYSIESRGAASYTSASITSPSTPSRSQNVIVNVIAAPPSKVDESSVYMLLRKHNNGLVIDSTRIVLDVAAKPRPTAWTASFGSEPVNVRIGDTVELVLRARTTDPVDEATQLQSLSFVMAYNPTILVPLLQPNQQLSVRENKQVLTTTIDAFIQPCFLRSDGDTITTLRAVIALGDTESTLLEVSDVQCTDVAGKPVAMASSSSQLVITNAWRYRDGRTRLVNPLQELLVVDVDPNPIVVASTLRIRNLPRQTASLVIVDARGGIRANLSQDLQNGKRDFTIAASAGADIVLEPGTYYARCAVESVIGGTLNSVVRLFIIQ